MQGLGCGGLRSGRLVEVVYEMAMPDGWLPNAIDHAVDRYSHKTSSIVYFAEKGISEAMRHAYEDHGGPAYWMYDLENNLHRAIALTINGQWQNDVVEWLSEAHALKNWGDRDFSKFRANASPEEVEKHARKLRGASIKNCPEYKTLVELHLVANAIRHGPGNSLVELKDKHPELWDNDLANAKLRPWYMTSDEPIASFVINQNDIKRYETAVSGFWQRISQSALRQVRNSSGCAEN